MTTSCHGGTVNETKTDKVVLKAEEEGGSNEVHAVSFYPKPEPVESLEWKALENRLKQSSIKPPKLELKELLEHLEYAFLQENNQLSVVISSPLSATEKTRLLKVYSWKRGLTVVKNEKNELIPQSTVTGWHAGKISWTRVLLFYGWVLRLCNAPTIFQRCMTAIFHELIEDSMEEFNIKIRDKKGVENLTADHLPRLENPDLGKLTKAEIRDLFLEEQLMNISDKRNEPCNVRIKLYEDVSLEMRQPKSFDNVIAVHQEGIMSELATQVNELETSLQETRHPKIHPGKLKSRWYRSFAVSKNMKNRAIELHDEDGNEFIVNKQSVKPYQKDALIVDKDEDITLADEGEVT
ncbi:hypothetical protein Tco_0289690 [Tanacetum coccineum]